MRSNSWGRRLRRAGVALAIALSVASAVGVPAGPAAAATPTWSTPAAADPEIGGLTSVSCPTTTFCMAVGLTGRVAFFSNGHWRQHLQLTHAGPDNGFVSVSCTSNTFCVAVDGRGYAAVFTGSRWQFTRLLDTYLVGVSCSTRGNCVAIGRRYAFRLSGSTWSKATAVTTTNGYLSAVSCATTTFCMAVGYDTTRGGVAYRFTGTRWTGAFVISSTKSGGGPGTVDCLSPTYCLGGGRSDVTATFNGHGWTIRALGDHLGFADSGLSCAAIGFCMSVGSNYPQSRAARWNGSSWDAARSVGFGSYLHSVSCPTRTWCMAVGLTGQALLYANGAWSRPVFVDARRGELTSVSCVDAAFCMAVDANGDATRWDGSRWGYPSKIDAQDYPEYGPSEVSCSSRSFCLMLDNHGGARRWNGAGWQVAPTSSLGEATSVSCVSATFCVATNFVGAASVFTGASWTRPTAAVVSDSAGATTVSCTTTHFCMAASVPGIVNRFDGSRWLTRIRLAAENVALNAMACASPTFCLALDGYGRSFRYTGSTWVRAASSGSANGPLTCPSSTFCLVLDGGVAGVFDGSTWTYETMPIGPGESYLTTADCSAPTFCAAAGGGYLSVRR